MEPVVRAATEAKRRLLRAFHPDRARRDCGGVDFERERTEVFLVPKPSPPGIDLCLGGLKDVSA
jgi:hypothetical protein